MSSIIKALSDLATSLVELVWSFFTTAGALLQKTAQFALNFATEIIDLVVNFFRGLVDLAGGIVSFLLGKLIEGPPTRVVEQAWILTMS
jgi:phage-related protein